jgi:hypothetical protein
MLKMQLFEAKISQEGISALRKLLGVNVCRIFSPGLDVYDHLLSTPSLSIPVDGNGYVIVENSWMETPKEYIDYWQISVHSSQQPKDIKVATVEGIENVMQFPVSSINLQQASHIVRIYIYEAEWEDPECEESVLYDKGVVFEREDGSRFCIMANESIADLLEFTKDEEEIERLIQESRCRIKLESSNAV